MGCASSKHRKRCVHCRRGYSPVDIPRRHSVHHPPQHSDDSCHMVALSSSSLGSLKLCDSSFGHSHKHLANFSGKLVANESGEKRRISGNGFDHKAVKERLDREKSNLEMQAKLMEAKVWSSMMNEKIPKIVSKTPILTPPGEPETINTWEMMDGLEDLITPLRSPNHVRSFSFDRARNDGDCERPKSNGNVKPLWLQMEEEGLDSSSIFEDFDPEIISSFRKSLQELPSDNPFHISIHDLTLNPQFNLSDEEKEEALGEPIGKDKVILYFTSLRGIRKTYEESCDVRITLKSLGIRVDERDVSMHSGFKDELKELLGDKVNNGVGITLPRVFLGKKYLGGAEEIRKLNEYGKLEKILQGCEKVEENKNGNGQECEACGDIRFVPCETCSGSCKVYYEDEEEDDESEKKDREYGFQTCTDCNENGLIRCPLCCD